MKSQTNYLDFNQYMTLHIKSLQYTGLWFFIPYPKSSIKFWLHILMRIFFGVFILTIPPLGQIMYVVKLLQSGDFEVQQIASSINLIFTELEVSLKLLDMFWRRQLLTSVMDQLLNGDFHRTTHTKLLVASVKLSRRLFWCFLVSSALDIIFHIIVVPGLNGFRTLPVKMDLLFVDINEPAYFTYAYIYEVMYKPSILVSYIVLQTLPWSLLSFLIAQLDILIDNMKHMKKLVKTIRKEKGCKEDAAFKEVFNSCVLHHRAIIRFVDTIKATFGGQFALTLICSSIVICTTGVQFFAIESPSKDLAGVFWVMAYLQIFVLILFTDCYFGNAVYVKSTDLATVAYESPWLKMPQKLKKNLIVFIARAQQPLEIAAYNLVPVSLPTFTKVMNWTYKAFAVMNGMKK